MAHRDVLFGIAVTPLADRFPELVAQVKAAERGALDLVGVEDHPYERRHLDTFSLIADLLARTSNIHVFPDVADLPLRGPGMIARAASSLDVMSQGRFELGLGAGAFGEAIEAVGGPDRRRGEAVDALEEAIPTIRAALDGGHVVTAPAHRVELWLGAYRPRGLRLTAQVADGWLPSLRHLGPSDFRMASALIDEAALRAGRDPSAIRRIYNVNGSITGGAVGDSPLVGPVELWIDTLSRWIEDLGIDAFVFWPSHTGVAEIDRFAEEIVPAVRGPRPA